ncbi:LAGLIDADG family homing endonuclease [Patescibacteria group bacterium AH-259-L07]|nr:LAGLIDADG family homing endonuclease [Patescibacteria group bacterium AH-259-L07]
MKVNTVGKKFSEDKLAYTAGFLDADGAIMATIEEHKEKKFGFRVRLTIKISQKNKMIIDWFLNVFRFGYIRNNRGVYEWVVRDQKVIKYLLELFRPYLKVKKRQATIALKILDVAICTPNDLLKVANLADSLSKLNVRSKGRRKNFATMIKEDFSRND